MPCRSDYLDPTPREEYMQRTAKLHAYALRASGKAVPQRVEKAAGDCYCRSDFTSDLCALIKSLPPRKFKAVVYDAHSKESRELASWWEDHVEVDRRREKKERDAKAAKEAYASAVKKLTPRELKAVLLLGKNND